LAFGCCSYIFAAMLRVDALLNAKAQPPSQQALANELDTASFADLLLLHELGFADDMLLTTAYVHKPPAQRLRAGPVSGSSGSLGNGVSGASKVGWRHCERYSKVGPSASLSMRNWFARLSALPAFASTLLARWAMHRSSPAGALTTEAVDARLSALFAQLNHTGAGAGYRNSQRWPFWEKLGARRMPALPFADECAFVRNWTHDRLRWLDTVRRSAAWRSAAWRPAQPPTLASQWPQRRSRNASTCAHVSDCILWAGVRSTSKTWPIVSGSARTRRHTPCSP
jgi:hypothetical protein